jgi:hypothetical protein
VRATAPTSEDSNQGRDEQRPHDRRVERDRERESEPKLLQPDDGASDEAVELSVMTIAAAMTMSPVPPMQLVGGDGRRNQYSNSECEKTAAAS